MPFFTHARCLIVLASIINLLPTDSFTTSTFLSSKIYQLLSEPNSIYLNASSDGYESNEEQEGIRLNKVFKATHSRREADKIIESGRVRVNGKQVQSKGGYKVVPFQDVVELDGKVIKGWEKINAISRNDFEGYGVAGDHQNSLSSDGYFGTEDLKTSSFEYVKYFKPLGVTCTTDLRIKGNIINSIHRDGFRPRHRVYPVGRLDKETSGLILLTSDGRLVNSVLRGEKKQPKVYKVMVDGRLEESDLQRLRDGVTIRTVAQRKGRTEQENTLIAKTKKCGVKRIGPCSCEMTLVEGRNRQIRKMMQALGFTVVKLHRVEFMGIRLTRGLKQPGDWDYLDANEMKLVENALRSAQENNL